MPQSSQLIQTFVNLLLKGERNLRENHEGLAEFYEKNYPELRKQTLDEPLRDVICKGDIDDPCFNTNIPSHSGKFDQMNWGYFGQGPLTLAYNILYLFSDGDQKFSRKYAADFVKAFLEQVSQTEDLKIEKEIIHYWVEKKRNIRANNILFFRKGANIVR